MGSRPALTAGSGPLQHQRLDVGAITVLVGLCAIWGMQGVSVKLAMAGGLPPLQQAVARSIIAGLCVLAWTAARQGRAGLRALLPDAAACGPALLLGAVFGGEFAMLNLGLRLTTASVAVLSLYTAPFFTCAAASLVLPGERLRLRQLLGLLIAFAGVALAFGHGLHRGGNSLAGDGLCLAAAVMWALNTVLVKALPALRQARAAAVLVWQLVGSLPVLLLVGAVTGEPGAWPHATSLAWASLAYQGVVVAFASYLTWFWLVLRYPAGRLSGFTFATPVFGILAGAVVLREPLGIALAAGVAAIAVGLRLVND